MNPASSSAIVGIGSSSARNGDISLVRANVSSAFLGASLRVYQQDGDVVGPDAGRRITWASLVFPPDADVPSGLTTDAQALGEVIQIATDFCDGFDGLYEDWSPIFRSDRNDQGAIELESLDRLTIRSSQTGERMYTAYFSCFIQGTSA